jgi:hypothetical protein
MNSESKMGMVGYLQHTARDTEGAVGREGGGREGTRGEGGEDRQRKEREAWRSRYTGRDGVREIGRERERDRERREGGLLGDRVRQDQRKREDQGFEVIALHQNFHCIAARSGSGNSTV